MGFLPALIGAAAPLVASALSGNGDENKPRMANIMDPFQQGQTQQTYGQAQQGLGAQQAFLQALQGQNGIGNQQNVFNQQQGLSDQLQSIANGGGPNPAMAQLANATGQNIASQAALLGSQRGLGANPGLMARQIAQQGAGIQQNSAGQAAALQAQQQLNALGALQGQQSNMANLASQQVSQQQQGLGQYNQFAQNLYGQNLGAVQGVNNANVGMQSNMNTSNAGVRQQQQGQFSKAIGGALGGLGSAAVAAFAQGGMVDGPSSFVGRHLCNYQAGGKVGGTAQVAGNSPKNDTVPAMLSPGEIVIPRSHASNPDMAAAFARAVALKNSGRK